MLTQLWHFWAFRLRCESPSHNSSAEGRTETLGIKMIDSWLAREKPYFLPGSCFNRGILQMVISGREKWRLEDDLFLFEMVPLKRGHSLVYGARGPDNSQATTFNLTRLISMKPWSIMVHTDKWIQMACHSTIRSLLNEMSCFRISCLEKINPWKVNFHGFSGSNLTV